MNNLQRWFLLGALNALSVAMGFSGPMLLNGLLTYFQVLLPEHKNSTLFGSPDPLLASLFHPTVSARVGSGCSPSLRWPCPYTSRFESDAFCIHQVVYVRCSGRFIAWP